MAKNHEIESNEINLIGSGTTITGDVVCEGDIRIDGNLIGNLNTKGKVVIGNNGVVKGEVKCKNSDVLGKVEGKITVSDLLSLKSTAKLFGDIITNKLAIEPNAILTGTCSMGANTAQQNGHPKGQEQKELQKTS